MTAPECLKRGDKIAIVSTARKVTEEELLPCIGKLESFGLKVVLGKNIYSTFHQFAGNDRQRAADLQIMLDNPAIKAILCTRGGYGTGRIIDLLDFRQFVKTPKWIIGFSDITCLHAHIHTNFGIETIHSLMAINFLNCPAAATGWLKKALFGENVQYAFAPHPLNRLGSAEGIVTGGNLSMIYSQRGTNSDLDTEGKILFIEDVDEYLYHIDRMMMNLKRSALLSGIAGLVVGGMAGMKDNEIPFGNTAEEIIAHAVAGYDYPVCFNFPAGHIQQNYTLILGRKAKLIAGRKECLLDFNP